MKHTDGVPCAAENLTCSHLTKTYWSHQAPAQCARWATIRFGSTPLCWQHAEEYRREARYAEFEAAQSPAPERRNRRRELEIASVDLADLLHPLITALRILLTGSTLGEDDLDDAWGDRA